MLQMTSFPVAQHSGQQAIAGRAAKLSSFIWGCTFFLFMGPQWAATGHIPTTYLLYVCGQIAIGIALSMALYWAASALRRARPWKQVAGMSGSVIAVALAYSVLDAYTGGKIIRMFMYGHSVPEGLIGITTSNIISYSWLFGMLGTLYIVLQANETIRERESQLLEARSLAQAAQLAALRLQLNPHFLFNTLNAISSLIVNGRTADGEAMLGKLSSFLRTALSSDLSGEVTLEQEMETLQTYLEIESVRFGNRLSVDFRLPPNLGDVAVPSFVLQPLVENAIKHGVARTSMPVLIEIFAERQAANLVLTVRNTSEGIPTGRDTVPAVRGTGIGLANIARRLEVLYGPEGTIEAKAVPGGFSVTVGFPIYAMQAVQ